MESFLPNLWVKTCLRESFRPAVRNSIPFHRMRCAKLCYPGTSWINSWLVTVFLFPPPSSPIHSTSTSELMMCRALTVQKQVSEGVIHLPWQSVGIFMLTSMRIVFGSKITNQIGIRKTLWFQWNGNFAWVMDRQNLTQWPPPVKHRANYFTAAYCLCQISF